VEHFSSFVWISDCLLKTVTTGIAIIAASGFYKADSASMLHSQNKVRCLSTKDVLHRPAIGIPTERLYHFAARQRHYRVTTAKFLGSVTLTDWPVNAAADCCLNRYIQAFVWRLASVFVAQFVSELLLVVD